MKELFNGISELAVLEFLLIGISLFLGLRLVQKGLNVYMSKKQANPVINRIFPIFEFVIWIGFLIWGAKQIFQTGIAGSIVLLVLLVGIFAWAGSFVVRDWIAGVVFKAEDRCRIGDIVSFQNIRGRLTNLGYRALTIENSDGSTVEIPYSAFVRESAIEKIPRETACCVFKLLVPVLGPFPEVCRQLETVVMCTPWTSIIHKPCIRVIEHQESHYLVEVAAHMIDQQYAPEVEAYVTQYFNRKI